MNFQTQIIKAKLVEGWETRMHFSVPHQHNSGLRYRYSARLAMYAHIIYGIRSYKNIADWL